MKLGLFSKIFFFFQLLTNTRLLPREEFAVFSSMANTNCKYKRINDRKGLPSQKSDQNKSRTALEQIQALTHYTVSKKMKKAKSDYYSSRLTETQDPKTMWKILKEIVPNKKTADAIKLAVCLHQSSITSSLPSPENCVNVFD